MTKGATTTRSMDDALRDDIALLVKFWGQTEGRDKLTKMLQYGCRGLAWYFADNPEAAKKLTLLFKTSADSRKIFRLGKWLNEYTKLKSLIIIGGSGENDKIASHPHHRTTTSSTGSMISLAGPDVVESGLLSFSRFGFLLYWIYDNMNILTKIGVLTPSAVPVDVKGEDKGRGNKSVLSAATSSTALSIVPKWDVAKKAFFCWWIGLVFGLLLEVYRLQRNLKAVGDLSTIAVQHGGGYQRGKGKDNDTGGGDNDKDKKKDDTSSTSPPPSSSSSPPPPVKTEATLLKERHTIYLNLVKQLGDFVTASNGLDVPLKLFGTKLNDGVVGLSGFISAFITCYQMYPTLK